MNPELKEAVSVIHFSHFGQMCGQQKPKMTLFFTDRMCAAPETVPTAAQAGRLLQEETSALFVSTSSHHSLVFDSKCQDRT